MRKYVFSSVLIVSLSLIMLSVVSVSASSPAIKIGVNSSVLDADGKSIDVSCTQLTTTSNNNNAQIFCKFEVDAPGIAVHWNADTAPGAPAACSTDDASQSTLDWKETISASGQGTFICHFKD